MTKSSQSRPLRLDQLISVVCWCTIVLVLQKTDGFFLNVPAQSRCQLHKQKSGFELFSLGEPDQSEQSKFYRNWQQLSRKWDRKLFQDDDCPGLTYVSPIEWAPWMETIWFGNYYDYKSAYFQDVMYSNAKEGKEGVLLVNDPAISRQLALLYQRYKKFDTGSYSLSNATFFNIFGAEALRMGRYKLPQNKEVIICVTDPLTFSDMRRYFNSFNIFKLLKSKFMQQKRKRQYVLSLASSSKPRDHSGDALASFFAEAVYKIEYQGIVDYQLDYGKNVAKPVNIPVLPGSLPSDNISDYVNTNQPSITGVCFPTSIANSQYFMEVFWDAVLDHILMTLDIGSDKNNKRNNSNERSVSVIVAGDGRLLNDYAAEVLLRVFGARNVKEIVLSTPFDAMSVEIAEEYLNTIDTLSAAIVLSAVGEEQGLQGSWGAYVLLKVRGKVTRFTEETWRSVINQLTSTNSASIMLSRPPEAILSAIATTQDDNPIFKQGKFSFGAESLTTLRII